MSKKVCKVKQGLLLLGCLVAAVGCKQAPPTQMETGYEVMTVSPTDRMISSAYSATIRGRQDIDIYPQVGGIAFDAGFLHGIKAHGQRTGLAAQAHGLIQRLLRGSCFFQMSGICAVKPRAILFSNINALFVQAVRVDDFKQMLHKLCNTGTFLIKDHFNALCVSIIRAVQRVCCSVGSPGFGRPYTGHRVKKMLDAPKAPACNVYRFHTLDFPSFTGTVCIHALYSLRFPC